MTDREPIPFLDLVSQHATLESELIDVFRRSLSTAGFIGGPMVEEFEQAFANFSDVAHAVGVGSGTEAVLFALLAAGVQPGDVVVTVPHTFIATTEAIVQAGARPEFVDIDARTYNLDVAKLREYLQGCTADPAGRRISPRTGGPITAVVPVHLYGQMADMDPILELAEEFGLQVIEDACQAHGAEYYSRREGRWRRAGSIGRAAAFSFYPGKNLGACGEAGAVTTNDPAIAARVKMLRDHGQSRKYYHDIDGYNGRLDAIQAGVLHTKLAHLPAWTTARRARAAEYHRLLEPLEWIARPYEPEWSRAVYHLYVIRIADREGVMQSLRTHGIGTGIHYPVPLHLQKACAPLGYVRGDFPVAEAVAAEVLSLPIYPELSAEHQARVVNQLERIAVPARSR
jgi:dTDP-4-amino-4,6-dideoxygalactose transaminase